MASELAATGSGATATGLPRTHRALGNLALAGVTVVVLLGGIFMAMPFVWMVVTGQKDLPEWKASRLLRQAEALGLVHRWSTGRNRPSSYANQPAPEGGAE